ncbi:MAG: enoyl-CoA hydratase/isomerase family protein [Firmicutes bacterium]|jgi:enoyl-CoA hydratase/carnithine racemase|uniref:Crotonase n=1 Tax=Sulfobacillus benefaciens TaxID=453960 RepID=A0A2T2WY17_9FIRM|nr:enoyl-CoA hydratase/isomerase family protein [Bacillota bacterium]PSR27124.1 MAG: crotonase [Sulfobacillus benefaciens]
MTIPLLYNQEGSIAIITLNRPEKLNSLNPEMMELLERYVNQIEEDPQVRAVIIQGNGKAFSTGADLNAIPLDRANPITTEQFLRRWYRSINRLATCSKPSIARVHGYVLAGGLELMMACDLAVATLDCKIGDQHTNFGLIPGGGSTQRLPRLIGERRAKWLLYSGAWVTGQIAHDWGLVNEAVPTEKLDQTVLSMAQRLSEKSPFGLLNIKYLVDRGLGVDLDTGLDMEVRTASRYFLSEDCQIGIDAFLHKDQPKFLGR